MTHTADNTDRRETTAMNRAEAIKAITDSGKTAEQAEAFLNLIGSAFARRGWVEGEPLSPEGITANVQAFSVGGTTTSGEEQAHG